MKTDAIKAALGTLGFTHDVSGAMAELKALEEAHAAVVKELHHLVRVMAYLEDSGGLNVPGLATLNGARAALRKAGVLP